MQKQNVFQTIRRQLLTNEIDRIKLNPVLKGKSSFTIIGYYPEKAIVWLTTKKKLFKVAKITKSYNTRIHIFDYTIEYKDFNEYSDFVAGAIDKFRHHQQEYLNKRKRENMPVTIKFLDYYDEHRQELECPNWSNEADETGYRECPNNNREYEHLTREDNCTFELFCQWLGYDNYQDYIDNSELDEDEENKLYDKFREDVIANIYEY